MTGPAPLPAEITDVAPLSEDELRLIDAYWRAANYLSVGQAMPDGDAVAEPVMADVRACQCDGVSAGVGRPHLGGRACRRDRDRDGAAARADVHDPCGAVPDVRSRGSDQLLGRRTRRHDAPL
jgi:hypothetical protein